MHLKTGNTALVYAIICRADDFYDLQLMTLSSATQVKFN